MARAGGRAVSGAKANEAEPAAPGAGTAERQRDEAAGGEPRDQVQEAAETAAATRERTGGLGRPGRAMNRRSPFYIGMTAAAGVAITYGVAELIVRARSLLILIGLALFIAVGLDPVVTWLTRRNVPRWAAVLAVILAAMGVAAGFLALAIPPLTSQATALAHNMPHYIHELENHNSALGRLNARYHIQQNLTQMLTTKGSTLVGGILGAGEIVLSTVSSALLVGVLTIYFLADLPQIKRFGYRLVPASRRPRAMLITEEILARIGGYMLGNLLTSVIAGAGTFVWMLALGIPYPFLLALLVALLDLIPIIGSTIGGAVVTLVALTVSVPVAAATLGFYIAYRLAEDYLITPRVMNRTVEVPAVVTLVAVLIGGTLLGIIGALVAIPLAAAIHLLLNELAFRRLDTS
ncbi:MAG TPA: AI-2E family transporter [Streptosporangiaceae bacterium]|nr:AI-2E family transporter [Streptosporangiaceae bacterium]